MKEQRVELYERALDMKLSADALAKDGWRIRHMLERRDYIIVVYTRPAGCVTG